MAARLCYVRVLEIPTPRWTLYDKGCFNVEDLADDVPFDPPGARLQLADLVQAGFLTGGKNAWPAAFAVYSNGSSTR